MTFIPGNKLIIVDIQPSYENACNHFMADLIESLNEYEGEVLYLFNGPEMGFESEGELKNWLIDNARNLYEVNYDEESDEYSDSPELSQFIDNLQSWIFVEKGYGFIRDTLDEGYKEETIEIVQLLLANDLTDIRDIPEEEYENLNIDEDLKEKLLNESLSITLPSFNHDILTRYNGATLIGGGENECLLEIEVMMIAMKLSYSKLDEFIYS